MSTPKKSFLQGVGLAFGLVAVAIFGVTLLPQVVHAVTVENVGGTLGFGTADLKETIINIIKLALGLLGLVAVIIILYGGFLWLTSRGNEQQIDKAKRTLINGVIGLVIILLAWAIVLFVQRFIINATTPGAGASGQCQMSLPAAWGPCNLCDDSLDPRPDYGLLIPDLSCITPQVNDYYALWESPAHGATNVKLCEAVSAGFGGLPQPPPNPPWENDVNITTSTMAVAKYSGGAVNGTIKFVNNIATFDHTGDDFATNTEYTVDVSGIRSIDGVPSTSPIPPEGWKFTSGTVNDQDPPIVAGRCSNNNTIVCQVDADCGAGNACSEPTAPFHGETIQCLSPIIEVHFSEGMYPPSAMNPANFKLEPPDAQVARIVMPTPDIIQVTLDKPLVKSRTYRVTLNANNGADTTKGYRDTCSNALDCGDGLGVCADDGTATGATPPDDYRFDFITADTETVDCSPIVTGISSPAFHGNRAQQNRVTITGSNFGLSGGKIVRFNGNVLATQISGSPSQCFANSNLANQPLPTDSPACIQSVSNTQIQTIVPTGPLSYSPTGAIDGGVVVIKGTQESPVSASTDIQSPHINSIYPREGKAGRLVTINGQNFGASGTVRFRKTDGTTVPATIPSCTPVGWSDTEIVVQVPASANLQIGDIAHIQVDTDTFADVRGLSNTSRFDYKDIEGPSLCSIAPSSSDSPTAGLDALGEGFGSNQALVGANYSNLLGTVVTLVDDKNLRAAPAVALPNGLYNFYVTVNGRASNSRQYRIPENQAPEVVRNGTCSVSNPVILSPNPQPDTTNVCRNIGLTARFTEAMNNSATGGTTDPNLFFVRKCNQGVTFDPNACSSGTVAGNRVSATYTKTNDVVGFSPSSNRFDDGFWYEVTIKAGVLSLAGARLSQDVVWHFRIRDTGGDCQADAVAVMPAQAGPLTGGGIKDFEATATNANCAFLLGLPGAFSWSSDNTGLATVAQITNPVSNLPSNNIGRASVPSPLLQEGTATLTATYSGKSASGKLTVQQNYCEKNDDCNTQCAGATCNTLASRCNPLVKSITPATGPAGNLVLVDGCFFGPAKGDGDVLFGSTAGNFSLCGPAAWSNTNITVAHAPEGAPLGQVSVTVKTASANGGLTSVPNASSVYTVANVCTLQDGSTTPTLPATGVPQLCNITPTQGKETTPITYNGFRLPSIATERAVYFAKNNVYTQTNNGTFSITQGTGVLPVPGADSPGRTVVGTKTSGTNYCVSNPQLFSLSCQQNSECSTGCCTGTPGICSLLSLCTDGLIQSITPGAGTLACRNSVFQVNFTGLMQTGTLNASNVFLFDPTNPLNTPTPTVPIPARMDIIYNPPVPPAPATHSVRLTPSSALINGTYRIIVKGGVNGVASAAGKYLGADYYWPATPGLYTVNATSKICKIARTEIVPSSDAFTCSGDNCGPEDIQPATAGNQHSYTASAYDSNGVSLALQATDWTQGDSGGTPGPSNVYTQCAAGTPPMYCSQSLNVPNGQEQLNVIVTGTNGAGTGTASANVRSFLCAKPWPAAPNLWPFRDPDYSPPTTADSHNFTTTFCGDTVGDATLALPVVSGLPSGPNDLLKEYFLFVQDAGQNTGDAIGVRVHGNRNDLSPRRWYEMAFGKPPSGSTLEVDGYPAIREGRTVYVAAGNLASNDLFYPNIYVISYSDKARSETIKIFEQLLKNWRFNDQGLSTTLLVNFRADTKRMHAYNEIIYGLEAYKAKNAAYPALASGSFIAGVSMTAWPSWQQELGTALGITMPKDPEPRWEPTLPSGCPGPNVDPTTCWDPVAKVMKFPNDASDPPKSTGIIYRRENTGTVTLYGTTSNDIGYHSSTLTGSGSNLPRSVNVCSSPSTCTGFNFSISSGEFNEVNANRIYVASTDTLPPLIPSVLPAAGNLQGTVDVVVTATDNRAGDSGIASVAYSITNGSDQVVNGATVTSPGTDGKYHWSWNTRTLLNAGYTLTVTATDKTNKTATATRTYTLNNPPGDGRPPVVTSFNTPDDDSVTAGIQWNGTAKTLTATATDNQANDTGIAKIEFYLGTSLLAQAVATGSPTSFTGSSTVPASLIQQFPNGTYTYSVVAYDVAGNTAIRQATVTVQRPSESIAPTISIIQPTATISGSFTNVVADASDNAGGSGVDRVEFFVDGATSPTLTDFTSPYGFSWSHAGYINNSSHTLRATAVDRAGNSASDCDTETPGNQASPCTDINYTAAAVADNEPPKISGVVPLAGSVTGIVTIGATLTDNRGILRGELRIDNVVIPLTGGVYSCSSGTNCTINYPWNTLPELVAAHTIRIIVYDTANNVSSVSLNVTVDNDVIMTISKPQFDAVLRDTVPVEIDVSGTCSGYLTLANVVFHLDSVPNPLSPQPSGSCSGSRCTYTWDTLTAPNGTHELKAIGTDDRGCQGGSKVKVRVANSINDVAKPIIESFTSNGADWKTSGTAYIDGSRNIAVTASDPLPSSGIAQITITANGTNLGTCSVSPVSPCTANWSPTVEGTYTVIVQATDAAGNDSDPVSKTVIVDFTDPQAGMVSPPNNSTRTVPPYPQLQATAGDVLSGIDYVEFFLSGISLGTGTASGPLAYILNSWSSPVGTYTLYVVAHDRAGNLFQSASFNITLNAPDTTPPTIDSFTFNNADWKVPPTPASTIINTNGTIAVTATDPSPSQGGLSQVTIAVNGTPLTSSCSVSNPMSCTAAWNPVDGTYTVTVQARDVAGNNSTLWSKTVNVDKTQPADPVAWQLPPAEGSTVTPTYPALRVRTSDPTVGGYASGISSVIFYNQSGPLVGTVQYTASTNEYSWNNWGSLALGTYNFHAVARDNAGNSRQSVTLNITKADPDLTPPTVSIFTPATDNTWINGTFTLEAVATDNPGGTGVRDVQFRYEQGGLGSTILGLGTFDATSGRYRFNWNTTVGGIQDSPPFYEITAYACDNNNNCALTTSGRIVNIGNGGTICGPILCSGATPQCCTCATRTPPNSCIAAAPTRCPVCF